MYKIVKRIDHVNFFPSRKGIIYISMPIHLKTRRTGKTHLESGKFSKHTEVTTGDQNRSTSDSSPYSFFCI